MLPTVFCNAIAYQEAVLAVRLIQNSPLGLSGTEVYEHSLARFSVLTSANERAKLIS